jgi:hypothetical protein
MTLEGMFATMSGQVGFFDAAELVGPLPEGSFFALLVEHGVRIVRGEDFAACYSPGMGRPSIPPSRPGLRSISRRAFGTAKKCSRPGGRKVVANGIFELEDGRIVRERQVLSGDPK